MKYKPFEMCHRVGRNVERDIKLHVVNHNRSSYWLENCLLLSAARLEMDKTFGIRTVKTHEMDKCGIPPILANFAYLVKKKLYIE